MTTLDREWERIQERTFTKWINSHLKKRGMEIEDVGTSFQDGVKLINLYEIISDEPLPKYYKQPKMKIHSIANLSSVVDKINTFVNSVGIKVHYSAEQVYAGEKRQILGLIWCLIHKFEIQDISEDELSAKEGLLLWVQKKTKGYKDVDVQNFHYSFQDGLAFCALIHRHRPDLIDFDSLSAANKKENLELAFKVAEEKLDIPQLLDSQDMIDYKPDEKSVMTYVAYYWKKFASSQKNEKAANVIGKNISRQRQLEQLQSDYERRATALLAWIGESKTQLVDVSNDHFGYSLEAVTEKNVAFKDFKNNQKPTQLAEKLDLEVLLANLRSQQKNAGLPLYTPPQELSTESINVSWSELNDTQETYEKALKERIALMKRLDILVNRFTARAQKIEKWQADKTELFGSEDISKLVTVAALSNRIKTLDAFSDELAKVNDTLEQSKTLSADVITNRHVAADSIQETITRMEQGQSAVTSQAEELKQKLEEALRILEELIAKLLQFAKLAEVFNLTITDANQLVTGALPAFNSSEVAVYQTSLAKTEQDLADAESTLTTLASLQEETQAAGGDTSAYTPHRLDALQQAYADVKEKLAARKAELEEKLRADYEARAQEIVQWAQAKQQQLADTSALGNNLAEVQAKNEEFISYKYNEKPAQEAAKTELAALVALITYDNAELNTEAVAAQFAALDAAQDAYETSLNERLALMQRLELLLNRFRQRSAELKAWASTKADAFTNEDISKLTTVAAVQARLKALETFSDEYAAVQKSLTQVKDVQGQEIINGGHTAADEVNQTIVELEQANAQVIEAESALQARLNELLASLESIINKCLEYARAAESLNLVVEDAQLALGEPVRAASVADVESYEAAIKKVGEDIEANQGLVEKLTTLKEEVAAAGQDVSEYSAQGVDLLSEKINFVKEQLAERTNDVSNERQKVENHLNLLQEFNSQASAYSAWTEEQKNIANADVEGSLADQLNALEAMRAELVQATDEKLAALSTLYVKLEEEDIAEQSEASMQSLQVLNDQLKQVIAKRAEAINQAILAEKASNLSEEQLAEIANTFKHFDKDGNGSLSKIEFKAASASLGEDYTDEELDHVFASLDANGNGGVSFSEFVTFFEKVKREGTGYDDVLAAFETLTGGQPVVTEAQLRSSGMPKEEVDYLVSAMPAVEGGFDFKAYLAAQYGK